MPEPSATCWLFQCIEGFANFMAKWESGATTPLPWGAVGLFTHFVTHQV